MTTDSKPRIKITYATLGADNEDLHAQFEEGVATMRANLGGYHRNHVDGAWRDGDGTFEVRSGRSRTWTRRSQPPVPPSRPGQPCRGASGSRSSPAPAT